MIVNDFDESAKFGKKWEKHIIECFQRDKGHELLKKCFKYFPYDKFPLKQKDGIDGETPTILYDAKVRSNRYYKENDVLFEFDCDGKPGWHVKKIKSCLKDDKVRLVIHAWIIEGGMGLERNGYYIAYDKDFCDWITHGKGKSRLKNISPSSSAKYTYWWTENKVMDVRESREFIHRWDTRMLPKPKDLDDWL